MRILVTGGSGFIGAYLVRALLAAGHQVHNVDCLTYAAVNNTRPVIPVGFDRRNYAHHSANVAHGPEMGVLFDIIRPELVIHAAAETHVDRSIDNAAEFLGTNVIGTHVMLELTKNYVGAREDGKPTFCYVSTDEVYGPVPEDNLVHAGGESIKPDGFREYHRFNPRNPYAATKAAAEHLTMSYYHTHDLPVVITRCANTFGTHQVPEKFLPMMIRRAAMNESLPIYGDGEQCREWLYAVDHVNGIIAACERGRVGEAYNFGPGIYEANIHVAREILKRMGKPESLLEHVEDRPGHDREYSICEFKAEKELKWSPKQSFIASPAARQEHGGDGLDKMIAWYTGEGAEWCDMAGKEHLKRQGLG